MINLLSIIKIGALSGDYRPWFYQSKELCKDENFISMEFFLNLLDYSIDHKN